MLKSCEQCGKRYEIDPSDIKGQRAKFKCKGCGSLVTVTKPQEFSESLGWEESRDTRQDWSEDSTPGAWQEPLGSEDWPDTEDDDDDDDDGVYEVQDVDALTSGALDQSSDSDHRSSVDVVAGKPQIKGLSLKLKITLIIVFLVFFSLAAVGLIASYQSHGALSTQAEINLSRIADQKSREYGQVFERVREELEGMAVYSAMTLEREDIATDIGFPSLLYGETGPAEGEELIELEKRLHKEILQVQRIGIVLQSIVSKNPYLSLGYISTDNALTLFDSIQVFEKIKTIKQFHPHKRPWYISAKEEKQTIWTDLYVDAASDELTVTCATPIFLKDKTYKGVIGFDVLVETIREDILTLDIGYDSSYAFLVNKEGKVVVRPDIQKGQLKWDSTVDSENLLQTANQAFNAIIRNMVQMKKGIATYSSGDGDRYIAFAPIKSMNVSMGIVVFKKDVVKPATDMRNLIIFVLAGVLIVAILVGIFLGNTITKPINKLTVMADLMSQGQMDLEVLEEDRKDELGVLTKSFNRLIISLKMALSRR